MKLLTKEILKKLPALYATDGQPHKERKVPVKLFSPWTNWTWYGLEFDPEDRLFFGYVVGLEEELGYFCLDELEEIEGPGGLKIERDRNWDPNTTLEDVKSGRKR